MVLPGEHEVVLLLGAPGAGKGTQAKFLAEILGFPHVASGDLLREHRRSGTRLGEAARVYMDRGDLVPDDLVVEMIVLRMESPDAHAGVLLDGFPRTGPQAEALSKSLAARGGRVRRAIYLQVPEAVLVDRLSGRWTCPNCHATYHQTYNPSPAAPNCGVCGTLLQQRPDDRREVVANRVAVYLRDTAPVVDYYRTQGLLSTVNGDRDIQLVRADLARAVGTANTSVITSA